MNLSPIHIGPIQFDQPVWLLLVPLLWLAAMWMARASLSGLGTASRRVALAVRLIVILALLSAVARPSWRKEAQNVLVTVILDQSRSVPLPLQERASKYISQAAESAQKGDQRAMVTVAREAYVRALPGPPGERPETQEIGDRDGTNLADGVSLGMAVLPPDKANRILMITDGVETSGNLMVAAEAARAAHIPIDVLPLRYTHDREVMVERLVVPSTARMGETINLRPLINATRPTTGRLNILVNGEPMDLDPDPTQTGKTIALDAGINPLSIQVPVPRAGVQTFEAVFDPLPEPDGTMGDSIPQNNRALAITFVSGQGRVLVLADSTEDAAPIVNALTESKIETQVRQASEAPASLVELGAFDAVMLINTPAYHFSQQQQEDLRHYVHDVGGGLIMVGGPDSFGAGGWIGSPLADALPVKLDPPQKRQMPRGALVLMMHSCEMPNGNYWGKQTALAAVKNLSSQDLAGVVEYGWQAGGAEWVHPLSVIGDRVAINRAINSLAYGDAPSFDAFMQLAIPDLEKANAGQKHVIFISDGDPQQPSKSLMQRYINAKVSVSTVAVFPHSSSPTGPECNMMRDVAKTTGGQFYYIDGTNISKLPEIFIKEAQTVRRTLIWEGNPFRPAVANVGAEAMRGIPNAVPPITGYVVAAEREGLTQVVLRGQENDPILATWQYGLGKSVAFTSDATSRWDSAWMGWGSFRPFWEQHVRWAMRPGGSADVRVTTEDKGDTTHVTVEALDAAGDRLNFLRFRGRGVGPDGESMGLELRQTGPGRYEGAFKSDKPGSYVLNYRYDVPVEGGPPREGTVQAAVTRPFADEFRALVDNSALLQQVATITGGRVLKGDPQADDLWSRAGLNMPVALTPIWLYVACSAIGLFLVDVGVRRVRVDIQAMAKALQRGLSARREKAGQQMGSLLEARGRAQQAMAQRAAPAPQAPPSDGQAAPAIPMAAPADGAGRGVKFEATADELAAGKKAGAAGDGGPVAPPPKPGAAPVAPGQPKPADAEGISRLLKAKKRAQDQMDQD